MSDMAAKVTVQVVESASPPAALAVGRRWQEGGAVRDAAPAYGGCGGFVIDDSGVEHDVWVGVVDRRLTGECDCADADGDALCAHAAAVALEAVAEGMDWAPAPRRDTDGADPAAALVALSAAEKGSVLDALLAERPDLLAEARALAVSLLAGRAPSRRPTGGDARQELRAGTAAEVKAALLALDIADLHAGYRPGHGYVDEYSAAAELVEQAIAPFEEDVRRRLRLGLTEAAEAVALGVLDGLEACEGAYDGDEVLCYAGDDLAEDYGYEVRKILREAGTPI